MICGTAHAVSDATLIRQLVNDKNQKLAQLEQCTKKMTGFKVAGISTLGLTAVGVAGDIALVNKNKEMDGQIASAQKELLRQQEKLNKLQSETADLQKTIEERKAECETHKDIAKWDGKNCVCMDKQKIYDDGKCIAEQIKKSNCTSMPELTEDFQNEIKQLVIDWVLEEQKKVTAETICNYNNTNNSIPILLDSQQEMFGVVNTTCEKANGKIIVSKTSNQIKQDAINHCAKEWANFDKLNMCESSLEICQTIANEMPRIRGVGCECDNDSD